MEFVKTILVGLAVNLSMAFAPLLFAYGMLQLGMDGALVTTLAFALNLALAVVGVYLVGKSVLAIYRDKKVIAINK